MRRFELLPTALTQRVSVEEYLAVEERAEARSEYLDGMVQTMPSGSPCHLIIV